MKCKFIRKCNVYSCYMRALIQWNHTECLCQHGPCFWRCHNKISLKREQGWEPWSVKPLFSFYCPWLSQLFVLLWAFLLNSILTLIFPQLSAISLTDICMADGANGLANIYWVSVRKLPDWWLCWLCASKQTHDWKLHRGSIFQTNVWAFCSSLAIGDQ